MSFPSNWKRGLLGELSTVKARLGWKGLQAHEYLEDGFVFLATPNLKGYQIDFENVNYISKWRFDESPEIQLRLGDVLIVKDGSTLGIVNFVRTLPSPATVNGSIAVVRATRGLHSEYLFHFVRGEEFQKLIAERKSGLGVPHLFQADLREFAIDLPPLDEQEKISQVLTQLDRAIEQTEALIAKQQRLKTGLMQDLLTRGIDEHGNLRSEETHKFKDSPLGRIPVEWEVKTIASVLLQSPKNGYSPVESDVWNGTYMLGLGCLTANGFKPKQLKFAPKRTRLVEAALLEPGDFLITRSNTRALVGLVGIFEGIGDPCIYPDLMVRLKFSSEVSPEYMEQVFMAQMIRRQIENVATGTSGSMMKISGALIKEFQFLKPTIEDQSRILNVLQTENNAILKMTANLDKLSALKTALMQDLLTGRKRVTDLLNTIQIES